MSASSSSGCECDLCYNNYNTYTPIQTMYPELAHPYIYYAQVQRKQRPQKNGRRKNCFLKAFRWYTGEHIPKKIQSGTNNDVQGFAAWLDQKYEEYIRKSQITSIASSQYMLKPTTSVRAKKLTQSFVNETSASRRNKMKSPWRRRIKYFNKQNGDTIKKSDQSIEFIMDPKNISRSASECCPKCRHSNNAIMIDHSLKSKSESIIYILKEKELFVINSDCNDGPDIMNCNDDKININNGQLKENRLVKDTSCQCSIVKLGKVDACSQFSTKISNECGCVTSYYNVNERMNNFKAESGTESHSIYPKVLIEPNVPVPTEHPIAMSHKNIHNIHSAIVSRETSFSNKNVGKNELSFSVNGIAQTSDHAINLSHIVNPESIQPIFFKIICVDK